MTQNKEVHKNYIKVHRLAEKLNISPKGLMIDELGYPYKMLEGGLKGQRWYPGRNGYHPEGCMCGIQHRNTEYANGSHYDPLLV